VAAAMVTRLMTQLARQFANASLFARRQIVRSLVCDFVRRPWPIEKVLQLIERRGTDRAPRPS
jgi:hypothetical protein